jgi:hypothetical protein
MTECSHVGALFPLIACHAYQHMEPLNLLHVFKEYYSKHTNVVVAAIQTRDQNFHKTTTVSSYTKLYLKLKLKLNII